MLTYVVAALTACANATFSVLQRKANREVPQKENLEARDRAGRVFRLREQVGVLRRPGLQAAVGELPDRLRAHTCYRLDDDAVPLAELTLTVPECRPAPAANGGRPGVDGLS